MRDAEPRARRRSARVGLGRRPTLASRASAWTRTSRSDEPTGRRAAHPHRLEARAAHRRRPRPDPRATRRPRRARVPATRAETNACVRFGSHVVQVFSPVSRHARRPGRGGRARDRAAGRRTAALLGRRVVQERAVIHDRAEDVARGVQSGTPRASTSAPTTCTCIANPSAVEPSTAPSASSDPGRRRPSGRRAHPPTTGTTSRCSPAATIACAARGSKASPRSKPAQCPECVREPVVDRAHAPWRVQASGLIGRPASESSMSAASRRSAGRGLSGARHPVDRSFPVRRRAATPSPPRPSGRPGSATSSSSVSTSAGRS